MGWALIVRIKDCTNIQYMGYKSTINQYFSGLTFRLSPKNTHRTSTSFGLLFTRVPATQDLRDFPGFPVTVYLIQKIAKKERIHRAPISPRSFSLLLAKAHERGLTARIPAVLTAALQLKLTVAHSFQ